MTYCKVKYIIPFIFIFVLLLVYLPYLNNKRYNMNDNMIYALYCPIRKIPVYVGQTRVGIERPFEHIRERSHSKKVNKWVKELKEDGLTPVIVILESDFNPKYINEKECFWINKMINDGNILLNQNNVSPIYFSVMDFNENFDSDYLSHIRLFVRYQRKINKITQHDLAKKAGLGLRFLREFEQGTKSNFNTDAIFKLVSMFGNFKFNIEKVQSYKL